MFGKRESWMHHQISHSPSKTMELTKAMVSDTMHHQISHSPSKTMELTKAMVSDTMHHPLEYPVLIQQKDGKFGTCL